MSRLSEEQRTGFESVPLGMTQIPLDELLSHRVAEASGPVVPVLEQLWLDEVPGK